MTIHCLDSRADPDKAQEIWSISQRQCAHSFFTSWGWMSSWLKQLPAHINCKLVYGNQGAEAGICFHLVERKSVEHGIFYKNRAYLNATGDPGLDTLTIEYNGVLSDDNSAQLSGLFARPEFRHVEEFHLPGVSAKNVELWFDGSFIVSRSACERSYFVNLDELEGEAGAYLDRLSANRRSQIRKSVRDVEQLGKLEIRIAEDSGEALGMLDKLILFHQREWQARGEPGAFASEFFCAFHKDLIVERFAHGEIQMVEVSAGDVPIGYLYNFVYNNDVLFYQSGFNYAATAKCRPGLVAHYLTILHNVEIGNRKYNFLAGGSQYKKSLSTDFDELYWFVIVRRNLKSRAEMMLRRLKRRFA